MINIQKYGKMILKSLKSKQKADTKTQRLKDHKESKAIYNRETENQRTLFVETSGYALPKVRAGRLHFRLIELFQS